MLQGYRSKQLLLVWLVIALGLLATMLATLQVRHSIQDEAIQAFSFSADQVAIKVSERLESYELILRGGAALFEAGGTIDRQQWHRFVQKVDAENIVPGVQGIGFAQLIQPQQLASHIAAIRAEGFAGYQPRPAGLRQQYSPVVYLEPFTGINLRAFGFDMFSEPVRRAAMELARDSGHASLSGKVRLVQETDANGQPGTLMYVPVYRKNMPVASVEQRRRALLGWTYSPYRMTDLMSGILRHWESRDGRYVDLNIYDGSRITPGARIFDSLLTDTPFPPSPFRQIRRVDFHGHVWTLEFDRILNAPGLDYRPAWLTLAAGLITTALLVGLILALTNTMRHADFIASKLTATIREREKLLQESEFRWRFAVEGTGDGLWDWYIPTDTVLYSARWREMLGFSENEIGSSIEEWKKRIHPDDKNQALAALQAYLDGHVPVYASEHRMQCKNGHYLWTLDRGIVVSRNKGGQPLRLIGTQRDIEAGKLQEVALQKNHAELLEAQRIARMGSWRHDEASRKLVWTPELYHILGLDPDGPPPGFAEQRRIFTPDSYERLAAAVSATIRDGVPYELEVEFIRPDQTQGWALVKGEAARDANGILFATQGTFADITERKHDHLRIENLTHLYAMLSGCNLAIVQCLTQDDLFARICTLVVEQGGMKLAWIGLADPASGRISPAYAAGERQDYLENINISVRADDAHGRGPTGTATRENRPVWIDDFQKNPLTEAWHERARRYGWAASAAVPVCRNQQPIGALTFYSSASGWFDSETRKLLEQIGTSISYALDRIDALTQAGAYQATLIESEQRFRILVEQSIAGAFILQDHRIAYINPRAAQILGYADSNELMGLQLLDVIAAKDRDYVQQTYRKLIHNEQKSAELLISVVRQDGSLVEVGVNTTNASYQSRPAIIGLMQDTSDRKVAEDQIRRYARQLEHTFLQTVGLANTLSEMRDPYTAGHERRVAEIAVAIGREMGLGEDQLDGLRIGGYLHDVGKMIVPAEILAKPTRLTPVEYGLVQQHVQAGYDILKGVDFPWPVANIAHQHHERIDGSGYPQGLKGDDIILEARIIAVADVVESMASHRPYRPGLGMDKALAEIERGTGTAYDPVAVAACLRLFREKGFVIPDV